VTIFVTTLPSNEFDGLATVSFEAKGMSPSSAADDDAGDGGSDGDEHDQNIQVASVDETSQGAQRNSLIVFPSFRTISLHVEGNL